jgi:hypothetical protein
MSEVVEMSLYVSWDLNGKLIKMAQELAERCVSECASRYNFDGEEACRLLGLSSLKIEGKRCVSVKSVKNVNNSSEKRSAGVKACFPLPYNGELKEWCCYALRQNNGLYTQCQGSRRNGSDFCKSCITTMSKTGSEIPEYGTIQARKAVGMFEYVDPKGRKPTSYTKVMKKYKITQEQVVEEASKLNITIDPMHFVCQEETKRGRPSSKKEPKEKGVKGRPKKEKKVIEVDGDDDDDLFATLVANANVSEVEILSKEDEAEKESKKSEKKAEKEAKLAAEKAEKEAKLAAEKAEKEAKKAEKEAKLAAEKAEKEAKLAAEKAEKEAKLAAEKAEKEAKKAAEKAEKEAKKAEKETKKEPKKVGEKKTESSAKEEADEEPERVKKIEFEGKKYLLSKKSGVIYDYNKYISENDLVNVGVWNETTKKIEFASAGDESGEESEDEYDN